MQHPQVIGIRAGPRQVVSGICRRLDEVGVEHVEVDSTREVPNVLDKKGAKAVFLFDRSGGDEARQLLRSLRGGWSDVPVVVVVDKTNFDQYYELMCEGAYDYYEASEGAEVIADCLRWATHTGVHPPRISGVEDSSPAGCSVFSVA